jgi:hypothetical protein
MLAAGCRDGGSREPNSTPESDVADLADAIPSPEDLGMPELTRATDSGAFDADYATHYTLHPDDSADHLVEAGFLRGYGVTYYQFASDGVTAEATILLYVSEFASSEEAAAFVSAEAAVPQEGQPAVDGASIFFHVGPIDPPGLPAGFEARHFEVVREGGPTYSVVFAARSRDRYAEVVWLRFEDDAAAQASIGGFAAALDERVRGLVDGASAREETQSY